jgi:predicted lysophospholipase L1 biosynthesis ABC-type transport system permease subunit
MRLRLVGGRDFKASDDSRSPPVAVVNQAFAERFFQGRHPLGRRIDTRDRVLTVVGVVADSKAERIDETTQPFFYLPFDQFYAADDQFKLHVRTERRPETALAAVRRAVRAIDPGVATFGAVSLEQHVGAALFMQKTAATMLAALAAIAALLAALGFYGVMSYSVSRRTQEIGIRVALGATPNTVLRTVMAEAAGLTLAGVAAGLLAALAAARAVGGLLYRVSATDPLILSGATLVIAAITVAASYIPARRALRVDPVRALREE